MIRITHPHPKAGRQRFLGVEFVDGTAQVEGLHPVREQALLQHGATIELEGITLDEMTVRELREEAKAWGLEPPRRATKAELIDLIANQPVRELPDELDLESESCREFMAAHTVPLEPGEE